MTIQVVAMTRINPNAESALDKYMHVVGPLMQSAGARVVSRFELLDSVAGNNEIQYVTLVEYPDEAAVRSVFDSHDYKSLEEIKKQAFSKYHVNVISADPTV